MDANQINNNICEAIKTIVQAELDQRSYDTTIVAVIVDDSKRADGAYTVTDGSVKFEAFSESPEYRTGDQVLVSIQQGDWRLAKTIIRKYSAENNEDPVAYVPPLGTMLSMTDNLAKYGKWQIPDYPPVGILANGAVTQKCIWAVNLNELDQLDLQNNEIYSTLGLRASFRTLFGAHDYDIREGRYGLRLQIDYVSNPGAELQQSGTLEYVLDSKQDMFGDPYSYLTYFSQEKKMDISKIGTITQLRLFLYQTGDFAYFDGEHREFKELPHTYEMNGETRPLPDNILVRDIQIMFGHDLLKMEDNTLQIYTHQNDYYSPNLTDAENTKDIYLLWCNKTDANEYVGFSDGIYDPDYDEDAFRDQYEAQMKGMSLKAQDLQGNIPQISETLQMYANADLMNTEYKKLSQYLNISLYNLYRTFRQNLFAYSIPDGIINQLVPFVLPADNNKSFHLAFTLELMGNAVADIINDKDPPEVKANSVVEIYRTWLDNVGTNVYDHIIAETKPVWPDYTTASKFEEFLANIQRYWDIIIETTEDNYKRVLNYKDEQGEDISYVITYPNIRAFTETSEVTWKVIKKNLQATLNKILKLHKQQDDLEARLKVRFLEEKNVQSIDEEYSIFMDNHANRYCIYWYRYDRNVRETEDRYMGNHWQRLTEWTNFGRPTEEDPLNPGYLMWRCADAENGLRDILMNIFLEKEQFRAILFYNHEAIYSNILEFVNKEDVIDTTTGSLSDQIFIELSDYASTSFQLYGVNNCLINAQDARKQRFLRVRYHGLDEQDTALIGTRVYWYIPLTATMLQQNADEMKALGFSKLESKVAPEAELYSGIFLDGYDCYYKNINPITDNNGDIILDAEGLPQLNEQDTYFSFHIKDYYNATSTNNTIICRVIKGDRMLEDDQPFVFATFGTSGTDFTVAIYPSTIQAAIINGIDEDGNEYVKPLPVKIEFFDYNNEPVKDPTSLEVVWNKDSTGGGIAINPDLTMYYTYDEDTEEYVAAEVPYIDDNTYFVLNEKTQEYQQVPFEQVGVYELGGTPASYYHVLEANVHWDMLSGATKADQEIILQSYFPVPVATGEYYIEGTSMVIYDSMGKNPSYYKEPFKIFNISDHTEITGVTWELEWYKRKSTNSPRVERVNVQPDDSITPYLPTLSKKKKFNYDTQKEVEGYYFEPLNMFISDMDYYCTAICRNSHGKMLWAQPIIIDQNRYPSSMLNKWDEQLYINEEDNYILAQMFGAGYKDDQNRFFGVIMGDARSMFDDNSVRQLGLYGFHEGRQSFGLMVDGTMFLGKAGNGRIEFDGNNGTIRSGNYSPSAYVISESERKEMIGWKNDPDMLNTECGRGMKIDLEAGYIDAANFCLTSNWLILDYHGTKIPFRPFLWVASDNIGKRDNGELDPYIVNEQIAEGRFQEHGAGSKKSVAFPLMEVTDRSYFLQSINFMWNKYDEAYRDGMKIDLYKGKIWCWNFKLHTSFLILDSSGYPYFAIFDLENKIVDGHTRQVRYADFEEPVDSITPFKGLPPYDPEDPEEGTMDAIIQEGSAPHIYPDPTSNILSVEQGQPGHRAGYYRKYAFFWSGKDRFYMQSKDFSTWNKTGFKIDLTEGKMYAYSGYVLDAPFPLDGMSGNSYYDAYRRLRNKIQASSSGGTTLTEDEYNSLGKPPAKTDINFITDGNVKEGLQGDANGNYGYWPGYKEVQEIFLWHYDGGFKRLYYLTDNYQNVEYDRDKAEKIDRMMKFESKRIYINSMASEDEPVFQIGFGLSATWDGTLQVTNLNIRGGEIILGDPEAYMSYRPQNTAPYFGFFHVDRRGRLDATNGHLGGWELGWYGGPWQEFGHKEGGRYILRNSNRHWKSFSHLPSGAFTNEQPDPNVYLDSNGALYLRGCPVVVYQGDRTITLYGTANVNPDTGQGPCQITFKMSQIISEEASNSQGLHLADTYQKLTNGNWYNSIVTVPLT